MLYLGGCVATHGRSWVEDEVAGRDRVTSGVTWDTATAGTPFALGFQRGYL